MSFGLRSGALGLGGLLALTSVEASPRLFGQAGTKIPVVQVAEQKKKTNVSRTIKRLTKSRKRKPKDYVEGVLTGRSDPGRLASAPQATQQASTKRPQRIETGVQRSTRLDNATNARKGSSDERVASVKPGNPTASGSSATVMASPPPSSSGGSSSSVGKAKGGLATVRIHNKCRERAVVTVRYKPGTAAEVSKDIRLNAGSIRSLGAYVQQAEGTYELRSKKTGTLRSVTRGGEIVLETC